MSQQLRIVSLIASSTEIACALGLGPYLVGRSHECDFPMEVIEPLPVCTSPKFPTNGTSYEIDQRVRAILEDAVSVYHVDADLLNTLQPTHIITQSQCEVCAVSLRDVEAAACELIASKPQIVSLQPDSLADIWADIKRVGDAVGKPDSANKLVHALQQRIDTVQSKAAQASSRPNVACIEWVDPLMAAGNWVPELVELAGGTNLFGTAGKHSPGLKWEAVVESDPDVIIVTPCGFDIKRTLVDMPILESKPEWTKLKAVRNGKVYVADGNQYFNRPGPRVVESLEILAELLHPELFKFGHRGSGWIPYEGAPAGDSAHREDVFSEDELADAELAEDELPNAELPDAGTPRERPARA